MRDDRLHDMISNGENYEEAETYINAYRYNKDMMVALVKAIFGEISFNRLSPFQLP